MNAHILLVHDDPFMATMLTFVLTDNGYRVSVLADPAATLPFLAAHPVDLVLLDLLPRADCRALGAAIRRAYPALPVILHPVRGRRTGVDGTAMPFEPTKLLARIRAALRLSGQGGDT